jgi:hypothetical protein
MIARNQSWLAGLTMLVGVSALGLAGYWCFASRSGPCLEVDQTDIEVADAVNGENREVVLNLRNPSARPMRVLGLTQC